MAPAAALSTAPVTKRVHVGGLAPSVSPKDLVQRFSSFGTVVGGEKGVEGLGKTETGAHNHAGGRKRLADLDITQACTARSPSSHSRRQRPSLRDVRTCHRSKRLQRLTLSRAGMSMLNGSMWKAHKLRIGPAKPDWRTRCARFHWIASPSD